MSLTPGANSGIPPSAFLPVYGYAPTPAPNTAPQPNFDFSPIQNAISTVLNPFNSVVGYAEGLFAPRPSAPFLSDTPVYAAPNKLNTVTTIGVSAPNPPSVTQLLQDILNPRPVLIPVDKPRPQASVNTNIFSGWWDALTGKTGPGVTVDNNTPTAAPLSGVTGVLDAGLNYVVRAINAANVPGARSGTGFILPNSQDYAVISPNANPNPGIVTDHSPNHTPPPIITFIGNQTPGNDILGASVNIGGQPFPWWIIILMFIVLFIALKRR